MCKKLICLVSFVLVLGMAAGVANAQQAAITDGLVGYWPLDGNAQDFSGLGNHGTVGGNPTYVVGMVGQAMRCNGTTDYVGMDGVADDITTNNFTLAVWIKTAVGSGYPTIVAINTASGGNVNWLAIRDDLGDGMADFENAGPGPTVVVDDVWHHVAVTRIGNNVTLYVDGMLEATSTSSLDYTDNTHRWSLGQEWDTFTPTNFYTGLFDEFYIYNRGLSQSEIEIVLSGPILGQGTSPNPEDEAIDVPRDVILDWVVGEFADKHDVYFGTNFDDVNDATTTVDPNNVYKGRQDPNRYPISETLNLDFGQSYYWRVDEVNAPPDYFIYKGDTWSFTVEPFSYAIENITATASSSSSIAQGPENTVNGSGLDNDLHSTEPTDMWLSDIMGPQPTWIQYEFDKVRKLHQMWVWSHNTLSEAVIGYGIKEAIIEYSDDGANWTTLGTTHEFTRAPAPGTADYAYNTTVDLGGITAKYVKLTVNSNWGSLLAQYGLSEVRFFSIPVFARKPIPDSGATDVDVDVTLGFRAGRDAAKHDVYLSTDEQAVLDGNAPVTTVTENSYSTTLDLDSTYYWRVDEVNDAETPATWQGDIWNLSTQEFLIVDDFEDYNDYPPDEIWATWIDGYGDSSNGSTAGYPAPDFFAGEHYMETTIVYGGEQATPFFYSNTGGATYSEATRTFAVPQDWTKAGIKTLVLYLHGTSGNTGQLYVKVNGTKVPYDGDATDITRPRWKQWNIDLASLGVDLQSVTTLAIGIDGNGASGTLFLDNIRLYRLAPEIVVSSEEIWIEAEAANTITEPMLIYDGPLASGGKYIGTADHVGDSSDSPPPDGIATYNFTVQGGTYKVSGRIIIPNGDSFWARIPGATNLTPGEDPDNPGTGWVRWSDPPNSDNWYWNDVFSGDHNEAVANWTLAAGTYTLEIAYREDAALLDIIVISKLD